MTKTKSIIALIFIATSFIFCNSAQKDAKIGLNFLEENKRFTAYRFFEKALEENKKEPLALYGKGKIFLLSTETMTMGRELIKESLSKLPDKYFEDAVGSLVNSYSLTKEYKESIKLLQGQIDDDRESASVYRNLIANYIILRKNELARRSLKKALEIYPSSTQIMGIAGIYEKRVRKSNKGALKYFKAVFTTEANNKNNLLHLAIIHNNMRDFKEATDTLIKLKTLSTPLEQVEIETWIKLITKKRWKKKIQINN